MTKFYVVQQEEVTIIETPFDVVGYADEVVWVVRPTDPEPQPDHIFENGGSKAMSDGL